MKLKTILTISGVILLVVVVSAVVILKSMDFSQYKDLIEEEVKKATGRELKIEGEFDLKISLTPALAVNDVSFANASWGSRPEMVKIKRFDVQLNLMPLLFGKVNIKRFVLIEPDILLETNSKGEGNWVLTTGKKKASAKETPASEEKKITLLPVVNEMLIKDARLTYRDGQTKKTVNISLKFLKARAKDLQSPFKLDLEGAYNNNRVEVAAELGAISQLLKSTAPYPINLEVNAFGAVVKAKGTIKEPLEGKGLDINLQVEGPDLSQLTAIADVQQPLKGPFKVAARLTDPDNTYTLNDLQVDIGPNKLKGNVSVNLNGKRPSINISFNPLYLDLSQLGPAEKKEKAKTGKSREKSGRVFSSDPFPLEALQAADAIIKITNGTIISDGMEINNLELDMTLKNGNLSIKPVKADILDGSIMANLSLKTRGKDTADIKTDITVKKINIAKFLKEKKITDLISKGNLDVKAEIEGSGKSMRTLMADLNGTLSVIMDKGRIENKYVDFLASDLMKLLMPGGANKEFTVVNCSVTRFNIKNGIAESNGILLDTKKITVTGSGNINLADEKLNLTFNPKPKEASLISLAIPLHVRGTFLNPSFAPDTAALATKVIGGLIGNAILPGVGLLVPLVSKGSEDKDPCIAALSQKRPPPPSTTKSSAQPKQEKKKSVKEDIFGGIGKSLGGLFK